MTSHRNVVKIGAKDFHISNTSQHNHATAREWIGLLVIALPCMLYAMDLTVLNLALPAISRDLKPSGAQLLWIVDIYGFFVAGSLITMGTLGDRIGRRRLLLIGAALFSAASIAAAFSRSPAMLIAMRALLGFGGATIAPSTLSLIRNMFHDAGERTRAIGIWISSYSIGGAIGPLLGGMLLTHFRWGSVFLLNVPVMLLLMVAAPALLPEYRTPQTSRLDLLSALESLVAVLAIVFAIKNLAEGGDVLLSLGSIATGVFMGYFFLRRQKRLADPFIDLKLFTAPGFTLALVVYMLATMIVFGAFVFISQYLQLVIELSPFRAGVCTLPSMIGFVIGSQACPLLVKKTPATRLIAIGLGIGAGGFAIVAATAVSRNPWWIALGLGLYSFGFSPSFTLTTDLIVGSASPERSGAAAALSETGSELGGALGVALLGSLGIVFYGHAMDSSHWILDPELSRAARETLGGAASAAAALSPTEGSLLWHAAQAAFTEAVARITALCAALSLVLAFVVASRSRKRQP